MAIENFVESMVLPINMVPVVPPITNVQRFLMITLLDVINCARVFLTHDLSDMSRQMRFITLMDDLTEYKSDDEQQCARSLAIISSMYGPMCNAILMRLTMISIFRQLVERLSLRSPLEQVRGVDTIRGYVNLIREQTRRDADNLIMTAAMTETHGEPARKRQRLE